MAARARFVLAACVACLAVACAAPLQNNADCVDGNLLSLSGLNVFPSTHQIQSPSVQYLQDRTTVQVAQNFEVTYYSTYKVLTNLNPYYRETYVLYQCGTPRPNPESLGLPNTTKVMSVPLAAVSVSDTSVLTFLKLLGVDDRVAFVTPYAVDSCMQALAGGQCNRTDLLATPSNVNGKFLGYSVKTNDPTAIAFTATSDPGPLNRAEYIKYVATFFNREAAANTRFNAIVDAYGATRQMAASYKAASNASTPLVAWLYYQPAYNSPSYTAPEQVVLNFNAYRRQYTEDAGGRLHDLAALNATYGNGQTVKAVGSQFVFTQLNVSLAVLRSVLRDVDVAIDESYYGGKNPADITLDDFRSLYGLTDEAALSELAFLRGQRLLRVDGSASPAGTTAWFEEAVARPDEVLHDLVSAFLPAALSAANASPPRLVRSMYAANPGRVVLSQAADCPAVTAARCGSGPAAPICPAVYLDCNGRLVAATDAQPCAPTCSTAGSGRGGLGAAPGAAGRASLAPALLLTLAALALAAVFGWAWL